MYEPIFYIIHDIAPFVRKLQRATSIRMTSLFSALANTDYLCRSRDNPKNLILLLGAFSVILGNDPYSGMLHSSVAAYRVEVGRRAFEEFVCTMFQVQNILEEQRPRPIEWILPIEDLMIECSVVRLMQDGRVIRYV